MKISHLFYNTLYTAFGNSEASVVMLSIQKQIKHDAFSVLKMVYVMRKKKLFKTRKCDRQLPRMLIQMCHLTIKPTKRLCTDASLIRVFAVPSVGS